MEEILSHEDVLNQILHNSCNATGENPGTYLVDVCYCSFEIVATCLGDEFKVHSMKRV